MANKKLGLGTYCYVHPNQYNNRNLWLVKAIDLNRGRGILISDNPNDILSHIKTFYKGTRKEHNFKKMKSDGSTDGKDNIKGIETNIRK